MQELDQLWDVRICCGLRSLHTNLVQATILAIAAPTEDAMVDGCSWNESVIKTSLRPEVDPSSVLASLTIHGFRLRILSRRRRLGFLHFLLVRP